MRDLLAMTAYEVVRDLSNFAIFHWPWITPDPDFKEMSLFDVQCLWNGTRQKHGYSAILVTTRRGSRKKTFGGWAWPPKFSLPFHFPYPLFFPFPCPLNFLSHPWTPFPSPPFPFIPPSPFLFPDPFLPLPVPLSFPSAPFPHLRSRPP